MPRTPEPRQTVEEGCVKTSPKPCPVCRGSGHVILLSPGIDHLEPHERIAAGIGFMYLTCKACRGRGGEHDALGRYRWPPVLRR